MSTHYERFIPELPAILDSLGEFFMVTHMDESGVITYTNKAFLNTSKWTPKRVIGKTLWQMFPETNEGQEQAKLIWSCVTNGKKWSGVAEKVNRLGEPYYVKMMAIPINRLDHGLISIIFFELDVTQDIELQEKLQKIAFIDFETGLMSRHHLETSVEEMIKDNDRFTVVYITIDQFYKLKNMQSRDSEKELIKSFSNRLKRYFQDNPIARISVNEFVVLTTFGDWFIQGFIDFLKQNPIYIDATALQLSVSGGIVRYPENQKTYNNLMKAAITATKDVIESGGGIITSLSDDSHEELSRKVIIEGKLLTALDDNNLQVFYQPQIDIQTGKVVLYEALVRWKDDELGWIMPDELIPIAEESGMIHKIGEFVLKESAKLAAEWQAKGHSIKIAVNTSVREFHNLHLKDEIMQILEAANCSPSLIHLEITEKFAFQAEEENFISRQMQALQNEGIEFALDDFGTGYASFRYMQSLPISRIKIDKVFIQSMMSHPKTKKLVEGMAKFGESMGLYVIAEGVESEEQLELLKSMGINAAQGYHIGVPVTADEIIISD